MNKETRYIPVEVRDESEGRNIYGRAIVFDSYSNNLGFYEKINRSAITLELIDKSDIVFNFNHDSNQVLARRRNGKGSLNVELREDGVYFSFEAPNTTLGNDLLEQVKRGDISTCSFCFTVSQEQGSQKWEKRDGVMYREIMKIDGLYDLSAVTYEAYSDTSINARSLEARDLAEKEIAEEQVEEKPVEEQPAEEQEQPKEEKAGTPKVEDIEKIIENQEVKEETPAEETRKEDTDEKSEKRDINIKNKNNHNIMNKSLVKEIRNAIDNNQKSIVVNAETRTMTVQGYTEGSGQDAVDIDGVHDNVIETEIQGILEPLYANSVLSKLGVRFYKGLPKGDISVPVMGAGQVGWAAEIAAASATSNSFSNITLSPKRLTAYVDISKQLIALDTIGAEEAIRRDIVNALNDKLEATIFGDAAGDTTKPAGLFYGQSPVKNETFAKVCAAEAGVEAANVSGEMKYLMAPTTKAFYRSLIKGTNATGMVFENGEMDGVQTLVTSNIAANKYIYGNFNNLAVGSWGDVEITIDPYTQAVNGCVRLVVNAYFDAKVLRSEAFAFGKTV